MMAKLRNRFFHLTSLRWRSLQCFKKQLPVQKVLLTMLSSMEPRRIGMKSKWHQMYKIVFSTAMRGTGGFIDHYTTIAPYYSVSGDCISARTFYTLLGKRVACGYTSLWTS